jgi:long-chain fatty acid transport protein
MTKHRLRLVRLLGWLAALACGGPALGQGLVLPGAGPINLSMAGASTAAAVDVGASYWNPATISGLDRSEVLISSSFLFPSIHLQSALAAGAINGLLPLMGRQGSSRSDSGVVPVPTAIAAFRLSDDSPWTIGIGTQYLVGGGVNFPGSTGTPVLSPHTPPQYLGLGPIYGSLAVGISSLIASRQVTDRLAVAAGPLVAVETMSADPAIFAPPVNGPITGGYPTFPAGFHQRPFWGGGFQVGLFYEMNDDWNLGFSYKSPIWQERWGFNSATATGAPNRIGVQAGLPQILSWGVAYKGFERALIDVDLRYLDYANTPLLGTPAPPQGTGMGWSSVFAVAVGGQYQLTDALTLRAGYLFNTNPVPAERTLLNVQLPGITEHMLAAGATYKVTEDIAFSLAWTHSFRNAISGSIAQLPGSVIREDAQVDTLTAGLTISFGGKRKKDTGTTVATMPAAPPAPSYVPAAPPLPPLPDLPSTPMPTPTPEAAAVVDPVAAPVQ